MQRSWLSWIRSETSLRGLTSRSSTNRWTGLAVLIAIVLQAALAGLVADGAVERVVEQQVLHDHPLVFLDLGAVGDEHGPVLGGVWQPGTSLGIILISPVLGSLVPISISHIRQLATTDERRVPAVVGDVDPDPLGHLDRVELLPLGDRDTRCR